MWSLNPRIPTYSESKFSACAYLALRRLRWFGSLVCFGRERFGSEALDALLHIVQFLGDRAAFGPLYSWIPLNRSQLYSVDLSEKRFSHFGNGTHVPAVL